MGRKQGNAGRRASKGGGRGKVLPLVRRVKAVAVPGLLVLGIVVAVGFSWAHLSERKVDGREFEVGARADEGGLGSDPRVRAFVDAYGPLIDSVTYGEEDVVFTLGSRPIHFQGGRMLAEDGLDREEDCDPLFYPYALQLRDELPPLPKASPTYCTDVLESLWGSTEDEIRSHGQSTTFLGRKMFLNNLVIDALVGVERDILDASRDDPAIARWIDELAITYSFINRGIAGSPTRSHHAWGMALDLVPTSYEGRHVYWRWSRVFNREDWHLIPWERRWSPPQAVVEIFESHGFIWGGKWSHFDNIHFEYRPEILLYNRLIAGGRQKR